MSRGGQGLMMMMTATANQSNKDEKNPILMRDLTLKRSQKLGKRKHQSPSPHSQAGQAGQWGQRRPRHHIPGDPLYLLRAAWQSSAECPDPDPCTPTLSRPRHNTHSHPVRLTEVKS